MEDLDFLLFDKLRQVKRHARPPRGMTFGREVILAVIDLNGGRMRPKEIAEEIHVNASTLSEMLSKLETEGYVTRVRDAQDHRATIITLTKTGKDRALEIHAERRESVRSLFSRLSDDEKRQMIILFNKMLGIDEGGVK